MAGKKDPEKGMAEPVRRGGRPSLLQSNQLETRILDDASTLFLSQGYAATSIEAIAQRAGISKRTFYHRFQDKEELFAAVVQRLITRLRPEDESHLFEGENLAAILLSLARVILHASLSPQAIGLHRMLLCEAARIPELARIFETQGARQEAIDRITALLQREKEAGRIHVTHPRFAAEQFLHLLTSVPQRRAMGIGTPMTEQDLEEWASRSVDLFLHGCKHG